MHKVLIVANVSKEHIRKFHIPFISFMRKKGWVVDVACRLDVPVPEASNQFDLPCNRNPFSGGVLKSIIKLEKIIDSNQYDVIHCNTITGSIIARLASIKARKKGTRVFYTNHGLHYFNGAPISRWIIGYPMEKILAPLTDCLITINDDDYRMVKKTLKVAGNVEKIHGIGVDLNRFRNLPSNYSPLSQRAAIGINSDAFALMYVAELIENKNQEVLLESVSRLKDKYPNIVLVLVGPDHQNGALQQLACDKGIRNNVKFLGWRNDIPELLSMADIYVASSKSEGLGLNLIEAMACGLPVIAYDNRGHRELIDNGKNGFLVNQGNVDLFTDRIIELYEDSETKKRIVHYAQETIDKYETENVLQELWSIYQRNI